MQNLSSNTIGVKNTQQDQDHAAKAKAIEENIARNLKIIRNNKIRIAIMAFITVINIALTATTCYCLIKKLMG